MAITNKDIEKMKEVFATREDLEKLKYVFATKEDLKQFETKKEATKRHNEIMQSLDTLMKEKETAREDRVFAKAKDDEQDREISSLKSRVKKVEEKVLA